MLPLLASLFYMQIPVIAHKLGWGMGQSAAARLRGTYHPRSSKTHMVCRRDIENGVTERLQQTYKLLLSPDFKPRSRAGPSGAMHRVRPTDLGLQRLVS
jgi:hypothetical protein